MLTTSRKTLLLERLARDGQLAVTPLAQEFGVSEDTLRRDLRDLAAEGKLIRVHGGAVPASQTHQPVAVRRNVHETEKRRLAQAAARLIHDDAIVIVDGGTTHGELAQALPHSRRCTIVTHSPAIAASFEFHEQVQIVMIGGRIFRHSMVAVGAEAAEAFGSTPNQILTKVQFPLALPQIMLGINQTIMMVLSMVIIAGMVGAQGLGLEVVDGMQNNRMGQSVEAGLAIVIVAIMVDRLTQALARRAEEKANLHV